MLELAVKIRRRMLRAFQWDSHLFSIQYHDQDVFVLTLRRRCVSISQIYVQCFTFERITGFEHNVLGYSIEFNSHHLKNEIINSTALCWFNTCTSHFWSGIVVYTIIKKKKRIETYSNFIAGDYLISRLLLCIPAECFK